VSGSGLAPFFVSQCITSSGVSHTCLVVVHDQTGRNAGKACKTERGKGECTLRGVSEGRLVGLFGLAKMKLEWEEEADQKYIRDDTTRKQKELFKSKE